MANKNAEFMRSVAEGVDRELNGELKGMDRKFGFALVVFEFHKPGIGNYISNANRKDMIKSLKDTVERLESGREFPTPEDN